MRYGSIPAGGLGTRLQPIGFSKELAPVGGRAVIEYLLERMVVAGIDKIFINTAEDKMDLVRYLAVKSIYKDKLIFLVRDRAGLLDGIAQPVQFLRPDDELYFGLPDTIWFPLDGFAKIDQIKSKLVLGLFDTGTPARFDSVETGEDGRILSVQVKVPQPRSAWTWGIGKVRVSEIPILSGFDRDLFGDALHLYATLHPAHGVRLAGSSYLDIGQPEDYRRAEVFLESHGK